jgi:hypothetical protein
MLPKSEAGASRLYLGHDIGDQTGDHFCYLLASGPWLGSSS